MKKDQFPDPCFLPPQFFARDAVTVARALVGATLHVRGVSGHIVEAEADRQDDPASHSLRGPTRRNAAMFGRADCAYVHWSYGLHRCLNVVCASGGAVFLRALRPLTRQEIMAERRGAAPLLCAGPARVSQVLAIGLDDTFRPFDQSDFYLTAAEQMARASAPRAEPEDAAAFLETCVALRFWPREARLAV